MSSGQLSATTALPGGGNKIWAWPIDLDRLAALRPDPALGKRLSIVASVVVTALIAFALRDADWSILWPAVTSGGAFWLVFAINYFHAPAAEALIFGRLWNKTDGLFTALCRKQIVNTLVLPYAGDAMLLDWAHARGIGAFGGVKDAAILSGLVGSAATFLLVIPVWVPLSTSLGIAPSSLLASIGLLSAIPLVALAKRDLLFTLPGSELVRIGAIHGMRALANIVLLAWCWHLLLPTAPIESWLMLAAARMVVSRLPLLPNKEIAVAAIAVAMFPDAPKVAGVIAATGILITLAHAIVWIGHAGVDLARNRTAGDPA